MQVLLVWERGHWTTSGGAVSPGECKIEALKREVGEEVNVAIDEAWDGMRYLGGWSAGRARDNLVNDSFSAFSVKLKSMGAEWRVLDPQGGLYPRTPHTPNTPLAIACCLSLFLPLSLACYPLSL